MPTVCQLPTVSVNYGSCRLSHFHGICYGLINVVAAASVYTVCAVLAVSVHVRLPFALLDAYSTDDQCQQLAPSVCVRVLRLSICDGSSGFTAQYRMMLPAELCPACWHIAVWQ